MPSLVQASPHYTMWRCVRVAFAEGVFHRDSNPGRYTKAIIQWRGSVSMHGDLNFFLQFMNSLIPNFITAKSNSYGDTRKKLKSDNKALSGKY